MLFDSVILRAISRRFHRHVGDAMLDSCAADCGCEPIGRMCLLDDNAIGSIAGRCKVGNGTRILDMGCGRGFFGRWLLANGIAADYSGVERDENAVAAARRSMPSGTILHGDFRTVPTRPAFDVVTAIEVTVAGEVDCPLLDAAASALLPGGRLVVTVASVDGAYADRLRRAEREALCSFNDVIIEDWTQGVIPFAQRTYEWWLNAPWPPVIQEKSAREARTALRAIGMGNFHYAVLFALK